MGTISTSPRKGGRYEGASIHDNAVSGGSARDGAELPEGLRRRLATPGSRRMRPGDVTARLLRGWVWAYSFGQLRII